MSVGCGMYFTLSLDGDDNVWCWGVKYEKLNSSVHEDHKYKLEKIESLRNIRQVACGFYHALCLDTQGEVWALGKNSKGQLGLGDTTNQPEPKQIQHFGNISSVQCAEHHSLCLDVLGDCYFFGKRYTDPKAILTPQKIDEVSNVSKIATKGNECVFLLENGKVYTTDVKETELPLTYTFCALLDFSERVVDIATGFYCQFLLTEDGSVYSRGTSCYGELGLGKTSTVEQLSKIEQLPPIQEIEAGYHSGFFIDFERNVWHTGFPEKNSTPRKLDISDVDFISDSAYHVIIREYTGYVWGLGNNECGQLFGEGFPKFQTEFKTPSRLPDSVRDKIAPRTRIRQKSARK